MTEQKAVMVSAAELEAGDMPEALERALDTLIRHLRESGDGDGIIVLTLTNDLEVEEDEEEEEEEDEDNA